MTTEKRCDGCGAILIKSSCLYCGTEHEVLFLSKDEYYKIQKQNTFFSIYSGINYMFSDIYCGKQIIVRE